ncbi:hypothetical protein D3C74_292790 [compost metagenome]
MMRGAAHGAWLAVIQLLCEPGGPQVAFAGFKRLAQRRFVPCKHASILPHFFLQCRQLYGGFRELPGKDLPGLLHGGDFGGDLLQLGRCLLQVRAPCRLFGLRRRELLLQ